MDAQNPFNDLLSILERWSSKGEKYLTNGTRLICPTPNVAPEAWLHVIFAPLNDEEIRKLDEQCRIRLPLDFQEFLLKSNGAFFFSYWIAIWGLRKSYSRTGDEAWQPYDIHDHNEASMRPYNSPDTVLYFASDEDGKDWCFFEYEKDKYKIGKTPREEFLPIRYWPSFWEWLLEETSRLKNLYSSDGVRLRD